MDVAGGRGQQVTMGGRLEITRSRWSQTRVGHVQIASEYRMEKRGERKRKYNLL